MTPATRQARHGRTHVVLGCLLLLLGGFLIGATPITVTATPIYESAGGPLGDPLGPATEIVQDQSLGVKFHVSKPVVARSIGGYFAPDRAGVTANIDAAIVRLKGPHDFPDSFNLTTPDVWAKTSIDDITVAGDFAGNLSRPLRLTGGWYALVFAAPGSAFSQNAIMPRGYTDLGDPLYFIGTTIGLAAGAFEYRPDAVGDVSGARMFLDTDAASSVPEPSATLLLLALGLAGLGGVTWPRRKH